MPHKIDWYIPEQILFCYRWGDSTEDTIRAYLDDASAVIATTTYPTPHLITHLQNVETKVTIAQLIRVLRAYEHFQIGGWAINIRNTSKVAKMLTTLGTQFFHSRSYFADSIEEGIEFLRQADPNLDWDAANPDVIDIDIAAK